MTDSQITPLGRKIVVAILGTTVMALGLVMVLNLVPTVITYRQDASQRALAQAELLATSLAAAVDFHDPAAAAESLNTLTLINNVTGAAVYMADGTTLAVYQSLPSRMKVKEPTVDAGVYRLKIACPIPSAEQGSLLMLTVSLESQWASVTNYLLVGSLIFPVVLVFSYRIANRFRRQLGDLLVELTGAVNEISSNKDYSRRVDYSSNDEIGILMREFNAMLSKIEQRDVELNLHREYLEEQVEERTRQLKRKQQELENKNMLLVSEIKKRTRADMIREEVERINRHDLKSGLSLVIGYPEIMLRDGELNGRQVKIVKRIRAAGYRMLDMIHNYLDMFKLEKGIYTLKRTHVDLLEIICELEEEFAPLLENCGVTMDIHINGESAVGDENVQVCGEFSLIRTMFRNLIQNAIDASSRGNEVLVALEDREGTHVAVSNSTPVPKEVRRRFFDKYTTHGKDNGTGLGTYYAALIARTHEANITMMTDEITGTRVTVSFKNSSSDIDEDASLSKAV